LKQKSTVGHRTPDHYTPFYPIKRKKRKKSHEKERKGMAILRTLPTRWIRKRRKRSSPQGGRACGRHLFRKAVPHARKGERGAAVRPPSLVIMRSSRKRMGRRRKLTHERSNFFSPLNALWGAGRKRKTIQRKEKKEKQPNQRSSDIPRDQVSDLTLKKKKEEHDKEGKRGEVLLRLPHLLGLPEHGHAFRNPSCGERKKKGGATRKPTARGRRACTCSTKMLYGQKGGGSPKGEEEEKAARRLTTSRTEWK